MSPKKFTIFTSFVVLTFSLVVFSQQHQYPQQPVTAQPVAASPQAGGPQPNSLGGSKLGRPQFGSSNPSSFGPAPAQNPVAVPQGYQIPGQNSNSNLGTNPTEPKPSAGVSGSSVEGLSSTGTNEQPLAAAQQLPAGRPGTTGAGIHSTSMHPSATLMTTTKPSNVQPSATTKDNHESVATKLMTANNGLLFILSFIVASRFVFK
ncbi:hypothetical protein G9A89_014252 [Geosiphon pyriformis]|nr:hypothetical protein G9A89_014252 [Geosiphon pyriformis]